MEIRHLRALAAIAETNSFTAAAARIHITQAAISMQIRQLELETGTLLFVRTPRRCVLTHAGERLLERARRILREHDAALAELAELSGTSHGRLRLGSASAMFSSDQLPLILQDLRAECENVEVTVTSGTSEALVKQIVAGELDIAFISLPVEARGVQTELLVKDELIAIANPEHPLAHKRVISAFELAAQKLILGERGGNTRRLIDGFFAEAGLHPVVAMELSRLTSIKRMVESGMGVGIVPVRSALEEIAEGRLVRWWIEGAQINSELGFAYLSGGYQSPVMQIFINLCRANLTSDAPELQRPRQRKPRTTPAARKTKAKPKQKRR
ncbi:MAG TPA: LysR family transcriptional regulator [Pyrinomonadaceae bacterium]|nr:LysR family transcriptional regulator [Pyrinomonadaceae bacterium]